MPSNRLPTRCYAHPFDRPINGDRGETHGVGRDPDAIGGYRGVGWYETFRDYRTNEVFQVHCSDGVDGGKSSHSDEDLEWLELCQRDIIERTRRAVIQPGCTEIHISSPEWAVMLNFTFGMWLDPLPGEQFKTVGDANRHLDRGQIGTINNVPVIVDPNLDVGLPSPPSDQKHELATAIARIDAEEDRAEVLGY